jgi:hypothetical protein
MLAIPFLHLRIHHCKLALMRPDNSDRLKWEGSIAVMKFEPPVTFNLAVAIQMPSMTSVFETVFVSTPCPLYIDLDD